MYIFQLKISNLKVFPFPHPYSFSYLEMKVSMHYHLYIAWLNYLTSNKELCSEKRHFIRERSWYYLHMVNSRNLVQMIYIAESNL